MEPIHTDPQTKKGRSPVDERPVGDRFGMRFLTDALLQVVDLEFERSRASLPIFQKLRGPVPSLTVELTAQQLVHRCERGRAAR